MEALGGGLSPFFITIEDSFATIRWSKHRRQSRHFRLYNVLAYPTIQIGTRPFHFNVDYTFQDAIDTLDDDG